MSVVKKKKHVSKKNKKDWRKHCDISDVEAFLDDQRLDERLGNFSTKPDHELFIMDTAGDEQKPQVEDMKPQVMSARERKKALLANTTPKCFLHFLSTSKVQDPNAKRNHVNPVGSKPTALSKLTLKRKLSKGIFERKTLMSKKNKKMERQKKRKAKSDKFNFDMDMWGDKMPEMKGIPETLQHDMVPTEAVLHNVLPENRIRKKPPLAKSLHAPAVTVPHPGVSYNPTYKEHQELLQKVCEREEYMMKKEKKIHRATTNMFSKLTPAQMKEQWLAEMKQGLPDKDNVTPKEESDASDTEYKAVNPPVQNKKKDHKTRRKQKERLIEQEKLKQQKINKKKISDLYKLRKMKESIEDSEKRHSVALEKRKLIRDEKAKTSVPELSSHKVPTLEPDLVEPESLSGDLRNISVKSNLLRERYESLQRRGALAGAKVMMKKKRRLKRYFKPGHKVTEKDLMKYTNQSAKVK